MTSPSKFDITSLLEYEGGDARWFMDEVQQQKCIAELDRLHPDVRSVVIPAFFGEYPSRPYCHPLNLRVTRIHSDWDLLVWCDYEGCEYDRFAIVDCEFKPYGAPEHYSQVTATSWAAALSEGLIDQIGLAVYDCAESECSTICEHPKYRGHATAPQILVGTASGTRLVLADSSASVSEMWGTPNWSYEVTSKIAKRTIMQAVAAVAEAVEDRDLNTPAQSQAGLGLDGISTNLQILQLACSAATVRTPTPDWYPLLDEPLSRLILPGVLAGLREMRPAE